MGYLKVRVFLCLIFLPLLPGLALCLGAFLLSQSGVWLFLAWSVLIFSIFVTSVYPIVLLLGLPLYLFMCKCGWFDFTRYAIAAVIMGLLLAPSVLAFPQVGDGSAQKFVQIVMAVCFYLFGVVFTLLFWFIVRPDRMKASAEKKAA